VMAASSPESVHPHTTSGSRVLLRIVHWYQIGREGRPSPCRFTPSCSSYALDALAHYGTWRGLVLIVRRMLRCRPFGPSGWDPIPDTFLRKRVDA
jgi:putative membrane protein insertion efficiency factor